jgi:peroxiredoxin
MPEFAPDFERIDLAGQPVGLRGYRGKLVLLSFWATWCEPCRAEAPRFSDWQRKYGPSGFQVLGISMDDDAAPVREFVRQLRPSYPIVMGDPQMAEQFGGVLGLPLTFLVDPSGRIGARYRGEPDLDRMEARIRTLLPGSRR